MSEKKQEPAVPQPAANQAGMRSMTPAEMERAKKEAAETKMDAAQRRAAEEHYKRPLNARKAGGMIKMRSGGFVRSADGIAKKGKTRGKVC